MGTAVWCSGGIVLGVVFSSAIEELLNSLDRFGVYGTFALLFALLAYVAYRWYRRQALIKQLRMDRITAAELRRLILEGGRPVILDVRSEGARAREGIIPGSIYVNPAEIERLETAVLS